MDAAEHSTKRLPAAALVLNADIGYFIRVNGAIHTEPGGGEIPRGAPPVSVD